MFMATLFIMSGLPFSGKSTLSKKISEKLEIPRISFDETWVKVEAELGSIPGSDGIEQWKYINKACEEMAGEFLRNGVSVVYDNLGSSFDERQKMRDLAEMAGAVSKILYVKITKEEVIKRRERNLLTKERAQVSDHNFNQALDTFEPPRKNEEPLIYDSSQEMDEWVNEELVLKY